MKWFPLLASLLLLLAACNAEPSESGQNFNFDWQFHLGDTTGAEKPGFDDSSWRTLDLPHDWSVEEGFSADKASCTGYLPGGIGWYRKRFEVPASDSTKQLFVHFGGIYNNSEVYINGHLLGKRPNGYVELRYNLTPYLQFGAENVIAVKADHTLDADSRWYTGSGIYRKVSLIKKAAVHIPRWGVYVVTPEVSAQKATVVAHVKVTQQGSTAQPLQLESVLTAPDGKSFQQKSSLSVAPGDTLSTPVTLEVASPLLWDTETPHLYTLVTRVADTSGVVLDEVTTRVGIRSIVFDPDKGFFLNGKNMKFKGICLHHDAGTLGAAVPRAVWEFKLEVLKEMGCNAIRCSHNPYGEEFYDVCDEKGFLVMDEAFDEWEFPKKKWVTGWNQGTPSYQGYAPNFNEWGVTDLADIVRENRNHPSIIMWSIGNEIDYPNDPYSHEVLDGKNPQTRALFDKELPHGSRLGIIARQLAAVVKDHDTTRPVTAGLASALMSNATGYAEALDVVGYNYQEALYADDHARYPTRPLYGSETGKTLGSWRSVTDNEYIMGQFLWTGLDFLGEAGRFPRARNASGLIDLGSYPKPGFYQRQALWSDKPMVYIGTSPAQRGANLPEGKRNLGQVIPYWNWEPDMPVRVTAYTNCEEVELFLNDKSLGALKLADFENLAPTWNVPFAAGTLKAVGKQGGKEVASYIIQTAEAPAQLVATPNRTEMKADRRDVVHIDVAITDANGILCYDAQLPITCTVSGSAQLLGIEDANHDNVENYTDNTQTSFHGRVRVYIGSLDRTGKATVTFTAPGMKEEKVLLKVL